MPLIGFRWRILSLCLPDDRNQLTASELLATLDENEMSKSA